MHRTPHRHTPSSRARNAVVTAALLLFGSTAPATALPGGPLRNPPTPSDVPDARTEAITAYSSVYDTALRVPVGWTGSVSGCRPGTPSAAFETATLDLVNYFRAAAGLGSVTFDPALSADAQEAALMMDANGALTHDPPSSWRCFTTAGDTAASRSNLAASPGTMAINLYMADTAFPSLGHRRWVLYPPTRTMGAGSTDSHSALWVVSEMAPRPATPEFVAWPPPGHVPYQHVGSRWSFAPNTDDVDLSGAVVTMTRNTIPVEVSIAPLEPGYGDATLSWTPSALPIGAGRSDLTIHVAISGVFVEGSPVAYEYDVIVIDPANPGLSCGSLPATIVGTAGADTLVGTPGDDVIVGKGGGDVIRGLGGDDVICGGTGNDTLKGGDGRDRLIGGPGADALTGGEGGDWVDYITAPGPVTVDLAAGTATGGAGPDVLTTVEHVRGSPHGDVILGNGRNNRLYGMRGGDLIDGRGGSDLILGGPGADELQGRGGDDTIAGDLGPDTVVYGDATAPVTVDLTAGTATGGAGSDELRGVEHVKGSRFSDWISGNTGANVLRGLGGDDMVFGKGGDDFVLGGAGIDEGHGGPGTDTCRAETTTAC